MKILVVVMLISSCSTYAADGKSPKEMVNAFFSSIQRKMFRLGMTSFSSDRAYQRTSHRLLMC